MGQTPAAFAARVAGMNTALPVAAKTEVVRVPGEVKQATPWKPNDTLIAADTLRPSFDSPKVGKPAAALTPGARDRRDDDNGPGSVVAGISANHAKADPLTHEKHQAIAAALKGEARAVGGKPSVKA